MDKRWTEILSNEEIVKEMAEISEPEKLQELLKAEGYDFTVEEIRAFGEEIAAKYSEEAESELTEKDLEDVAGGSILGRSNLSFVLGCTGVVSPTQIGRIAKCLTW